MCMPWQSDECLFQFVIAQNHVVLQKTVYISIHIACYKMYNNVVNHEFKPHITSESIKQGKGDKNIWQADAIRHWITDNEEVCP